MSNLHRAEDRVQEFSAPIFGVTSASTPAVVGSATLLRVADSTYLITAAHVLDENANSTLYLPGNPLVELSGPAHRTRAPLTGRDDDQLDLAIMRLKPEATQQGRNVTPIRPDMIDVAPQTSDFVSYGFVGYPASQNKPRPKRTLRLSSTVITVKLWPESRYEAVETHPKIHLTGDLDRNQVFDRSGNRVTAPHPKGMSGGGVFRLGTFAQLEYAAPDPTFVGVGIEYRRDEGLLLGVRAAFVIASLRACYPETMPYLPELPTDIAIDVSCN